MFVCVCVSHRGNEKSISNVMIRVAYVYFGEVITCVSTSMAFKHFHFIRTFFFVSLLFSRDKFPTVDVRFGFSRTHSIHLTTIACTQCAPTHSFLDARTCACFLCLCANVKNSRRNIIRPPKIHKSGEK